MKKSILMLSFASVFVSGMVMSAPIANLKIDGDIKPPVCTINGLDG